MGIGLLPIDEGFTGADVAMCCLVGPFPDCLHTGIGMVYRDAGTLSGARAGAVLVFFCIKSILKKV